MSPGALDLLPDVLKGASEALPSLDDPDAFAAAFDRFGDANVVLLGEATHGTSEFYRARAAITVRLVARHGFRIVALEADWPDAAELDRFARNRGEWGRRGSFVNFPRWMWRNKEFAAFVRGLRAWNLKHDPVARAELRGLDVYSLPQSIAHVLAYLDHVDPEGATAARQRYACLIPYLDQPQRYGAAAWSGMADCEDAVVEQLVALLQRRLAYMIRDGEDYFDAEQNARVVHAAEAYYRAMYRGSAESWNQRDAHMFATLSRLLEHRSPAAKAVVWAHNSHVGDASATAMGQAGEFNIGQLCRRAWGDRVVSIGFGTDRGEVAAADDWSGPVAIKQILPARPDSWEAHFRDAGLSPSLTSWRGQPLVARALSSVRLERAIGVVYRPQTEFRSHYFQASLSRQFDAYVWFEQTSAVKPLPGAPPEGAPDIYPFGL